MDYQSPDRSFDSDILPASPPEKKVYKSNIKMGTPEGKQNREMVIKQQDTPLGNNEDHRGPSLKWNIMDYNSRAVHSLLLAGNIKHSAEVVDWPY